MRAGCQAQDPARTIYRNTSYLSIRERTGAGVLWALQVSHEPVAFGPRLSELLYAHLEEKMRNDASV
jgi:hypothetical protein